MFSAWMLLVLCGVDVLLACTSSGGQRTRDGEGPFATAASTSRERF